jgi:RNA polymerase sigma-70 factor, ECF subfamily
MESSRDLISSARIGNKAAFEKLLQPHISSAAKLAYAMLLDRTEAEDVVQEAALSAWRRLENVRDGEDFKPWFLGIVANRCRTVRRGSWWSVVRVARVPMTHYPSPEERLVRGADLRSALAALSAEQRAAILLHFYLDLPLEDVARALEISVAGVKSRINRALKRLRPVLRADEESV